MHGKCNKACKGRSKKRWIDVIQEDCKILGMTVLEAAWKNRSKQRKPEESRRLQCHQSNKEETNVVVVVISL